MDVELKSWRSRVEGRKRNAQKEIDKRKQILAEVSLSFTTNASLSIFFYTRVGYSSPLFTQKSHLLSHLQFQLRAEFGYDVNTADPQFAEKLAAKEKEYAKKAKEEKKREREEKMKAYKSATENEGKK